jgi:hypothetical protein
LQSSQPQTLNWTITSSDGSPVNDRVNVVAALYASRSQSDPDLEPGVAVPELENLALEFTSNGAYAGAIGANFNPPASCNYSSSSTRSSKEARRHPSAIGKNRRRFS